MIHLKFSHFHFLIIGLFLFILSPITISFSETKITRPQETIAGGPFVPLFGMDPDQKFLEIQSFKLDRFPVTHKEFFNFLKKNSTFLPKNIPLLFADSNYLKSWKITSEPPTSPPKILNDRAITYVSWFAANAFCESMGGRLPTVLEWEYAGSASETLKDGRKDPEFSQRLLNWYAKPTNAPKDLKIRTKKPNFYGIYDLHELIWEWTSDFNSVFVSGDNRQDGDKMKNFVCGASSTNSTSKEDYAAFLRYAMRTSLRPEYAQHNLGFRCAYSVTATKIENNKGAKDDTSKK